MQKLRSHGAPIVWLILGAIVLGGGLIATHDHDGFTGDEPASVALSSGHDLPGLPEHLESSTCIEIELCPACTAGKRQEALGASQPSSQSPITVTRGVRAVDSLAISGSEALLPAPRGPPTV